MAVKFDITGIPELVTDLTTMAAKLENGPGVDRALQAGAAPIERQMRANASRDPKIITGALHGSIHAYKPQRGRRGGKYIQVGVRTKERSAYYSNPVEYGHGGPAPAPPHPFVRPAFDAQVEHAYGEICRVLADEITRR